MVIRDGEDNVSSAVMAAKSSIRDTARVLELPLPDADRIAKLMPDISLKKLFTLDDKTLKEKLRGNEGLQQVNNIKELAKKATYSKCDKCDSVSHQMSHHSKLYGGSASTFQNTRNGTHCGLHRYYHFRHGTTSTALRRTWIDGRGDERRCATDECDEQNFHVGKSEHQDESIL